MPKVSFCTVGCKLNTYETEMLQHRFARAGYKIVDFGAVADVTIINTCTVTERADADCRKAIRRARRASAAGTVVVTGCMAERASDETARMSEVDLVIGNNEKPEAFEHISRFLAGTSCENIIFEEQSPPTKTRFLTIGSHATTHDHNLTRATLQVQQGCDEHCTYCIIPSVRGVNRSRPIDEIVAHAHQIAEMGYREVALTGVNTGSYGNDLDNTLSLIDVLAAIVAVDGTERVRINSIEPNTIDDALIDYITSEPKICRHYHIPLQSGSDTVLKRMNRRYRTEHYAQIVDKLWRQQNDAAIGADVMVGFPDETDAEFAETLRFIDSLPLTYLHVFSYSRREGTPATKLDGHHSRETKDRRNRELRKLGLAKREAFHRRHVDHVIQVLVEDSHDPATGHLRGLTDNYIRATMDIPRAAINTIVPVRVISANADGVIGTPVNGAARKTIPLNHPVQLSEMSI